MDELTEARRALQCLYLEAPESVVRDVTAKVEAVFALYAVHPDTQRLDWWEYHVRHRASMVGTKLSPFEKLVEKHGIREVIDEMKRQQETPSQARQ